jgi:hypothetical protein
MQIRSFPEPRLPTPLLGVLLTLLTPLFKGLVLLVPFFKILGSACVEACESILFDALVVHVAIKIGFKGRVLAVRCTAEVEFLSFTVDLELGVPRTNTLGSSDLAFAVTGGPCENSLHFRLLR